MPFKSEAQRKAMNAKATKGEIPKKVVEEYNSASKGMKLPKTVTKSKVVIKKGGKSK
jgi:hypothetical protein